MRVARLWLTDFRNYESADVALAPEGLTVVAGGNGEGKTNLLEALGYLATLTSFRGAPTEALIRVGAASAIVRAEGDRDGRRLLVETEIAPSGRGRVLVNQQPLRRSRDLLGAFRATVFAPDDLELVKGGPAGRRDYLDHLLVALQPLQGELHSDVERILRQRNALLKQAGGRLSAEIVDTLDVWDARLAEKGSALAEAREALVADLEPELGKAYDQVAHTAAAVNARYTRSWTTPDLATALADARTDDVRRGVSTVGPHRDELQLTIAGLPARTHASQGEQRSLALALRLAGHTVVTEAIGSPPTLLLDDVFSELDPARSEALLAHLPEGQALLTTAGPVPPGARPAAVIRVRNGVAERSE
ncbi:MAG TPA: DNA replication/repair protein RecF [Acidimicrobiales bacterium]|nr:DNA replication/repair protein RecF [Acidimicrobiales bacterium]